MRIFFYSTVFAPSVGGIETLVETLCRQFVALGHEVRLATEAPGDAEMPFEVCRKPSKAQFRERLSWCDIHLQANVSLKSAWAMFYALRKSLYQHNNVYQRDDGTRRGVDHVKTALARMLPGIANSQYTAQRTGVRDIVFNAYDDAHFNAHCHATQRDRDLVFLGRLVSQKGCDTLIDALGRLAGAGLRPSATVIGDGPDRDALEHQAAQAGVAGQIRFVGVLKGPALAAELGRHRVMVVPSRYEEPFGIVALEGLASGCLPIVSERGGLVDAVGTHGLVFPNGDAVVLGTRIAAALQDPVMVQHLLAGVDDHLAQCRARAVAVRYIQIFERHLERRA
ncbi:Glycosyltransferase involved in cell wall bisynthesis [[Luteovulum] sphaeroides subsp. megalophilum]|uniref:glycosyltransferase family 4 protein n=1 Tax=Cereibacter sphaeroides TaxID=1063 RepID=UPI000B75133B|nr:glycosyltransferase family 4 protein [Cereibacter sphaeroides]SNT40097.1 Glycosyltransferase involved in cell wall bisynthesis [[Luteovulum] sphaeroides subsp. megalophilum]